MAIIKTLRDKMTKLVVGFLAVAIAAFVLNDLLGSGPQSLLGGNSDSIGEIDGYTVSLKEYQSAISEREVAYFLSQGKKPGQNEKQSIQQQAWELLILRHAIEPQIGKLGIQVTTDEVWDMIQGKNLHPSIEQSFQDSLGQFDRSRVMQYINSVHSSPPSDPQQFASWQESRYRWSVFRRDMKLSRQRTRYENLLIKTQYVTMDEAEQAYHFALDQVKAQYLYIPFLSVPDSIVTVTEDQIQADYRRLQERFKTEQMRHLSYISFPLDPSSKDSVSSRKLADRIYTDFRTVQNDSAYAASHTDGKDPFMKYTQANLPSYLNAQPEALLEGNIIGPTMEGDSYKVIKIVKVDDNGPDEAKASHILIKWEDKTTESQNEARKKAQKILDELKNGSDFEAQARQHGQDGTAGKGGDLGWFSSGQMVKPFEDAVFNAKSTGLLPTLVETEFGYHIIKVTQVKSNTSYTVATVEIKISSSDETINTVYRNAKNFTLGLDGIDAFFDKAKAEGFTTRDAKNILPGSYYVSGIAGDSRALVSWLYRNGKIGQISDVIDLDDKYVVAVMTGEIEKGILPLEDIRESITASVKKEVKADIIKDKLSKMEGDLSTIKNEYGSDAQIGSKEDIKMTDYTLPSAGSEPEVVARIFSCQKGTVSKPFKGEGGVFMVLVEDKILAPEIADYTQYETEIQKSLNSKTSSIGEIIKDLVTIKDKRYRFF